MSLFAASLAAEQGRDVYAIPDHPFDPRAGGPNKLIQDGATLVQTAADILDNICTFSGVRPTLAEPFQREWRGEELSENDAETIRDLILQNMLSTPVTVDELVRSCHLTIPAVQMVSLELELAGRIQRLPVNRIVLIN